MLNTVIIQGRIAKMNELKMTQTQKPVISFTVACDRDYDRENTDFIPVVAWNQTADFIDKWFSVGQMILISGRLQVREWIDNSDKRHTVTEIIANSVNFCGDKKKTEKKENAGEPAEQYSIEDTPEARFAELNDSDAELPF